ncbi:MAG TPA: hypothetical protein VKU61_09595 [Candidatus Binatia bacterium]|nr:hypothetical protein [Candidatus Binatia bacterium]
MYVADDFRKWSGDNGRPRGTSGAIRDMTLALILGAAVVACTAYGFWMAGELGVAPRWRRRRPAALSSRFVFGEEIAR